MKVRKEESVACARCVHIFESSDIADSICYLCKRNPVDNRTDWFEEKEEENKDMSIDDIISALNYEQRDMLYTLIGYALETGRYYIAGNGDFDNHIQRNLRKTYNKLTKKQKIAVTYLVDEAINEFFRKRSANK